MIAAGLLIVLLGILTGLAWRTRRGAAADLHWFERINRPERIPILDLLWIAVRPLGRTWFLVLVLGVALVTSGLSWLSFAGVAALLALVEPILKQVVRRPRPCRDQPLAVLRLANPPTDPSFPSGDAGRAGLLAAAVCLATSAPAWACPVAAVLAGFVAVGRVRAGVHYPLDVWGGWWLGFGLGMAWAGLLPVMALRFG